MQRKNIPYIITYIMILLFFLLGALFYRQSFLAILFLLECLLPPLSLWCAYYTTQKLKVDFQCRAAQVEMLHPIPVRLSITKPTIFPLLNCDTGFTFCNRYFTDNLQTHVLSVSAQARREVTYDLMFETCYPGMFSMHVEDMLITDFLHLHTVRLPVQRTLEVPVMPKPVNVTIGNLPHSNVAAEEDDILNPYGIHSTESQGVRTYQPGDRLQTIHWKLSAKTDDLYVRDPQPIAERFLLLLPELERGHLTDTIATFYSFGKALLKENEYFQIGIFSYAEKTFDLRTIMQEDQLFEALLALYMESTYLGGALAANHYTQQAGPDAEYLSIYGKEILYYHGSNFVK